MRRRHALSSLASLALLGACNALPPADLQAPRLRFADFRFVDLGLGEVRFELTVDTENPNDIDVPLRNLDFDLQLLGRDFASGSVIDRELTLPARGSRLVPVAFAVPTTRLLELLRRVRVTELTALSYRLSGSASWGWSGIPLHFDRSGDLAVLRELIELLQQPLPR